MKAPAGGSVHTTKSGGEVARDSRGQVTAYRGPNGHEAHFDSHGGVREVHANGMTIRRGPGGERRVEMERGDHSRSWLMDMGADISSTDMSTADILIAAVLIFFRKASLPLFFLL